MKKVFLSFMMLVMALPMLATETRTDVYTETFTCADGWASGFVQIYTSDLTDLAADDKIQVEVTAVSATDTYPCVFLQYTTGDNWDWTSFADDEPHQVNLSTTLTLPYVAEFTLTQSMVDKLKAGHSLIVKGSGFTADKITFVHNDPLPAGTLWQGEKVMPTAWGAWLELPASKFADCKVGNTLRLLTKDVLSGAQAQLSSSQWVSLACKSFGGKYVDFELTDEMLTELQANGVNINGCSFTLTEVRYFDPSAEVKYTTTLNITQPDWTWADSKPVIGLKITNPGTTAVTLPVEIDVTTDKGEAVATYKQDVEVAALATEQEVNVTLSDIENPGIYRFTAYVNDEQVSYTRPEDQAYTWTTMNIAYKPTEISSPADAQEDFKAYWDGVKAQLKAIPMDAQLELVKEGTYRNLYKVTLNSIPNGTTGDPVQIRGYYAEVKAEGTYPTVVNFQGYDSGGTGDLWIPGADDQQDYNTLVISARGQSYGNRDPYKDDNIYCNPTDEDIKDFNIKQGWWFTYHFGDKDSYYYRGAYMDQVRGIDFVCSRAKVDKANIFCTGGSQGGAFTLVAAALSDGRVNAIAPAIQFMGDFPDYFQVGNWPVSEAKSAAAMQGMSEEEMYKFLSYYDTKNFASMITAPTLSSIGLQDNVCPVHTNLAPYNLLTCEKVLYINKNLVHETPNKNSWSTPNNTERDWSALQNAWWTSHKKEAAKVTANMNIQQTLGCATFCAPFDVAIPEDVKAYTADEIVDNSWIKLTEIAGTITAGTPVVLYGAKTADYEKDFSGTVKATEAKGTILTGNIGTENAALPTGSYILQKNDSKTGWYKVDASGLYVGVNRCYIQKGQITDNARTFYGMSFDGTTGINSIANQAATKADGKYLASGQLVVVKSGKAYNIKGIELTK